MEPITGNLLAINQQIAHAARDAGRDPDEITLIAASKTQPGTVIQQAYEAGIRHFGENYLDEALAKRADLATPDLIWHFIGKIQSNKTKSIAQHFDWVHTIDRYKIAKRLSDQRTGSKLYALIQVNIDADPAKGGVLKEEVASLVEQIDPLPNLSLRGLMTILDRTSDPASSYQSMAQLFTETRAYLNSTARWDTLSMGMSGDMAQAIGAGATQVRIGTALFGPRS